MTWKTKGIFWYYLYHYFHARSRFDIHSPFVYTLYSQVFKDHKDYPEYIQLKKLNPGITQRKYYRLLFRLTAWLQPSATCYIGREENAEKAYLHSGCPEARIITSNSKPEEKVDMVFIDLDFIGEPIIKSFSLLRQHISDESVFIIWSVNNPGNLQDCWKTIQSLPGLTVTINLFRIGLLFFNQNLSREDFMFRY
jgi:hypothetical protein